jgi:hypothetical protein
MESLFSQPFFCREILPYRPAGSGGKSIARLEALDIFEGFVTVI